MTTQTCDQTQKVRDRVRWALEINPKGLTGSEIQSILGIGPRAFGGSISSWLKSGVINKSDDGIYTIGSSKKTEKTTHSFRATAQTEPPPKPQAQPSSSLSDYKVVYVKMVCKNSNISESEIQRMLETGLSAHDIRVEIRDPNPGEVGIKAYFK